MSVREFKYTVGILDHIGNLVPMSDKSDIWHKTTPVYADSQREAFWGFRRSPRWARYRGAGKPGAYQGRKRPNPTHRAMGL